MPKEKSGTALVTDTNVLVHNPQCIETLREEGNTLVVPWVGTLELDRLKDKPDIGWDAREAINLIEEIRKRGDDSLMIYRNPSFKSLGDLDKKVADHQIIATAKSLQKEKSFGNVTLLSRDRTVRILARELGIHADDYVHNFSVPKAGMKEINVPSQKVSSFLAFPFQDEFGDLKENEGVICYSDFNFNLSRCAKWGKNFAAIRKDKKCQIIPYGISAMGLRPYSLNGDGENWYQHVAFAQLLDPSIELVFLQGGAGSGKTLLALACAIEQRKLYHQIIVSRPMIHLEDEDRMGFLPGDEHQKMAPWLRPIMQAVNFLKEIKNNDNEKLITKLLEVKKIDFEPLDYIRGMTYYKTFMIIDEAQNLTPHQIKTIITRAGMHTKLVFTGDLGQIDRRRRLDRKSSGLAYAIATMGDHPRVGVTTFKETVRSPLASLAEERM